MKRKEARELCMQLVYEMIIKNEFSLAGYHYFLENNPEESVLDPYVQQVLNQVIDKHEAVDDLIRSYAIDWEMDRIARVDLAILRVALAEMQNMEDIPSYVSVNEAIEMAKKFSTENSSSFVNGILGTYLKDRGEDRQAMEKAAAEKAEKTELQQPKE
jgi:transcription antitermination protein NusB